MKLALALLLALAVAGSFLGVAVLESSRVATLEQMYRAQSRRITAIQTQVNDLEASIRATVACLANPSAPKALCSQFSR
ncbi:MAG: hypothetical protein ACYDEN_04800 [Acidimicrobiales bacterium]